MAERKGVQKTAAPPGAKPIAIVNAEAFEPRYASHFVLNGSPNEWVLTVATVAPPPVYRAEDMETIREIPAYTVGRFILTREHAEALIDLLTRGFNSWVGRDVYRKEESAQP